MTTIASIPILSTQPPTTALLEANLAALALRSPRAADAVRRSPSSTALRLFPTDQPNALSGELDGRALASRRRPLDEAERLAETVDFKHAGAAAVLGFGLGHHIAAITRRAASHSLVIVFEPDTALLRSVLEHTDFTESFRTGKVLLFTDPHDASVVNTALAGMEAILALGVTIVEHAPSRARLEETSTAFAETLTRVVAACRTQVVTTMTQMEVTIRNFLMNADHYVGLTGAGAVRELKDAAAGMPAVVVSAGPSLERNLHLLSDPAVRDRCIIIAVQTVLKPMLARGIRPHFVTALDYHEISKRFYEGLTPNDVEGITLIAEPKANPAILDSFPGRIRLVGAETLDVLLGPDLARDHGAIQPGATVAHLAYSFGRHLGCDPLILIGQDLAFTDGQYYAAGAAIHDIWSTELNTFNTLETMEWQRIVRWRGNLHKIKDHLGRDVYTDDQMSTYLAQFERDFLADKERGLRIIDATEGGARKTHAVTMTLDEALLRFASPETVGSPRRTWTGEQREDQAIRHQNPKTELRRRLRDRLTAVRDEARQIAGLSRKAASILEQMIEVHSDEPRLNRLIDRVHEIKEQVQSHAVAYNLVHRLNQAGTFKRFRADRLLELEASADPRERQKHQIRRDITNVNWIAQAADSLEELIAATIRSLEGEPKRTRDPLVTNDLALKEPGSAPRSGAVTRRLPAFITINPHRPSLDARRLPTPAALRRTINRLARCKRIDRVIVLIPSSLDERTVMPEAPPGIRVELRTHDEGRIEKPKRSTIASRAFAPTCWRGGLGGLTCYDEIFEPAIIAHALREASSDAALLCGGDWSAIDPELCDAVVERHLESPAQLPFVFTQAPPGLCGCVVGLDLAARMAEGLQNGDASATLGGLLAYKPTRPRRDPIVEPCCVQIPAEIRALHHRFIADSPIGLAAIDRLESEGASAFAEPLSATPQHLVIELTRRRFDQRDDADQMSTHLLTDLVRDFARLSPGGVISLAGRGDPLHHPDLQLIIRAARDAGVAGIHVRTDLVADETHADTLLAAEPDVISVDLYASDPETYRTITGADLFHRAVANTDRAIRASRGGPGLPYPWIVPRIARRDAVYEHIEGFYDRALYFAAAGVIDPPPRLDPTERISPLPKPPGAILRDAFSRIFIRVDGAVPPDESDLDCLQTPSAGNALENGLEPAWTRLTQTRLDAWRAFGPRHTALRTGY